jgi:activator of HSP90 ATPase
MKSIIQIPSGNSTYVIFDLGKKLIFITAFCFLQSAVLAQVIKENGVQNTAVRDSSCPNTIHQEIDFTVSPQRIYEALLDSKEFSGFAAVAGEFSAKSAQIDRVPGGAFSLFEGHIIGRIVDLVPNQRVIQAWRVVDWPAGIYSIVRFELVPNGSGTHLIFDQTGFPVKLRDRLAAGWQSHYWDLLKKYLH